jgi:YHS domain-containing protein/uncharacterized membrane protein YraQ (UPF0718 family)
MIPVLADSVAVWAGRSLREGFFMFWETLWPLVLGFGLSGVVQAFVPRDRMERSLGDHRPGAVARASGYGMVSSSCSYAATAMAKSLFQKGADFVTAMVFMISSTNLVIELGIVLVVLIGWQFALAEFVGGAIMIVLLVLIGGMVFSRRLVDSARRRLQDGAMADGHDHQAMVGVSEQRQAELEAQPWSKKLTSKAAWADAASYTVADLSMLRKELVIGYVVAGLLATLVPVHVWNTLFIHGHGFWTSLENVIVGPFIAVISFVCSVGNVPLAAALWKGGISFGGVISFVFADLITFPLLMIYRKYYGGRLTARILIAFWAVMAAGGLIVEGLFSLLGLIPHGRPKMVAPSHFQWNYTTFLNIAFLVIAVGLYWLYRNRDRLGGGAGYALDPVCGMQVRTADAPAQSRRNGDTVWFCSDRCRDRFEVDPGRYSGTSSSVANPADHDHDGVSARLSQPVSLGRPTRAARESDVAIDPVCGMTVQTSSAPAHRVYADKEWFFCGTGCAEAFDVDPAGWATPTGPRRT